MKVLKIIIIVIIALAAIIIIGGMFLPKNYVVSRSSQINAPDSIIYNNIADFQKFNSWSPWVKMDPDADYTYSGNPKQIGHNVAWDGDEMGKGSMTILALEPYRMIDIDLHFLEPMDSQANTRFMIEPAGNGNTVTWTMSGENNLLARWMCVFMDMDKMVGGDFESGLNSLKGISEAQAK
ncbi:MAG: polyketide cyclase [Pedobacter sp.]|nr:MAG: polyketide cyclase [Pedobacter sp.]